LQQKVELYTAENDNLNAQLTSMRDELVNLKTLLLAHKDCPVSQQQGLTDLNMQHLINTGYGGQMNPYGMAAAMNQQAQQQQAQVMASQNMHRRYS
jgi:ATF/CREB family transcription factor